MQLTLGQMHYNLLSAAVQDEAFSAYLNRPELTPAEQVSLFAKVLGEDQTAAVSNFLTLLAENIVWLCFLKLLQNTNSSNHRITILWM
jgi:F0F1-type ATP synthase delta subunit